jgi:hypothetical protein
MRLTNESYPDCHDTKKSELQTPLKGAQVIEKKEENGVFHRSPLCLSTTTNLN